ncbi:hypothetical protein KKE48_04570 [Patescibacteria group bacterium]|nr:hypothetical protein [Patescibacteria group bacterium]MBU1500112.1 hypothetical protein [Patescibacteria group bacterium]
MNTSLEKTIIIPAGTEINNGPSEDSDSIIPGKPFKALIVGKEAEGVIPVRIFGENGQPEDMVRYFHQPPKANA